MSSPRLKPQGRAIAGLQQEVAEQDREMRERFAKLGTGMAQITATRP